MAQYDVRFTNNGRISLMTRGFFEKVSRLSFRPWNDADYAEVGPYRFDKTNDSDYQLKKLRRFFRSVGLAEQFDKLISEEAPKTATVYADGPFNYEVVGARAVEAAAEFQ